MKNATESLVLIVCVLMLMICASPAFGSLTLGNLTYVAGTYKFGVNNDHAGFIWRASNGFTIIQVPGSIDTFTHGINRSFETSGYFDNTSGAHGYVRNAVGMFTTFDVPGSIDTFAYGLNDFGQVTGSYDNSAGAAHGFIRGTKGGFLTFDPPGTEGTDPSGINNAGAVVGFFLIPYANGFRDQGFERNSAGMFMAIKCSRCS